ncbi:SDR family NAD(P)-dependent oxidoreductase [Enterovibrio sp. 27052020O]|uniref:SDR family NAD(P)-dependent oxidoreductase n=1 Tax=Enterovibrio sp. 27052020O TaxID=3241166 RepID=UPI00388D5CF1
MSKVPKRNTETNAPLILISGGASGIGLAVARYFHAQGWAVATLDRNHRDTNQQEGDYHFQGDMRCPEFLTQALFEIARLPFPVSLVFANVGTSAAGAFENIPWHKHQEVLDTNLRATLALTHLVLPLLSAENRALIVYSTSVSVLHGVPQMATYSATKAAIHAFAEALHIEQEPHGIRISTLMLGKFDTPAKQKIRVWHADGSNRKWGGFRLPGKAEGQAYNREQSPEIVGPTLMRYYQSHRQGMLFLPTSLSFYYRTSRLIPQVMRNFYRRYLSLNQEQ